MLLIEPFNMAVVTAENDHINTNHSSENLSSDDSSSIHSSGSESMIPDVDEIVDQIGFWSTILKTETPEHSMLLESGRCLNINTVALPADCSDNARASLIIVDPNNENEIVLCTLTAKSNLSQNLDCVLLGSDVVTLKMKTANVSELHVSGAVSIYDEDMDDESSDEDDEVVYGAHGESMMDQIAAEEDSEMSDESMLSEDAAMEMQRQALKHKIREITNDDSESNDEKPKSEPTKKQQNAKKNKKQQQNEKNSAEQAERNQQGQKSGNNQAKSAAAEQKQQQNQEAPKSAAKKDKKRPADAGNINGNNKKAKVDEKKSEQPKTDNKENDKPQTKTPKKNNSKEKKPAQTPATKGKVECTHPGCDKQLTSEVQLAQHMQKHQKAVEQKAKAQTAVTAAV